MRALVLALSLIATALVLPASAQASHITCEWDDVVCIATCVAVHDPCGVETPPEPLDTRPCGGSDDVGAVVVVLGRAVDGCVGFQVEPCPAPFTGVIVSVDGQPHGVCVQ